MSKKNTDWEEQYLDLKKQYLDEKREWLSEKRDMSKQNSRLRELISFLQKKLGMIPDEEEATKIKH